MLFPTIYNIIKSSPDIHILIIFFLVPSMSEQVEIIREKSDDIWTCPKCSFQNLKLLPQCEICENPKPKTEEDLKKIGNKQSAGFKCFSCNNLSETLKSKCDYCGVVLIPDDSDDDGDQYLSEKTEKKGEKPTLLTCPHCYFENDMFNEICVACEETLVQKPTFLTKTYAAPFSKRYPHYEEQTCKYCSMVVRKKFMINHAKICPARINSTQGYSSVRRTYCTFCYEKFDSEIADAHDETCPKRQEFFQRKENPTFDRMTKLQIDTIIYMHKKSEKLHWLSQQALLSRVKGLGYQAKDLENLHHYIVSYAPIIIHMHANNHMQFFVKDTHYRNQFETRKSSGSLSSSSRISWEDRMFDSKHHSASPFERVKYGTINFTNDPRGVGVCAGYGQSYFLLKQHVRNRCTVTDMDSSSPSAAIGTFQFCYHVFNKVSDGEIRAAFEGSKGKEVGSEVIGTYKEIQIHGPVEFKKDIERVYISKHQLADPKTQEMVKEFCKNNDLEYQIFEKPGMGGHGIFGGGMLPAPVPSASIFSSAPSPLFLSKPPRSRKPKKTKATAHLFGGGSSKPYFAPGYKPPEPQARIIPDSPAARKQPPKSQIKPRVISPPPIRDIPEDEQFLDQQEFDEDHIDDFGFAPQREDDEDDEDDEPPADGGVQGVDYI